MRRFVILFLLIILIDFFETGCSKKNSGTPQTNNTNIQSPTTQKNASSSYATTYEGAALIRCNAVKSIKIPDGKLPTKLTGCTASDYFYGINGQVIDYKKARQCALYNLKTDGPGGIFNSYQILEMIYANGDGVEQNLDLATKLACENQETDDVILALDPKKFDGSFDICNLNNDANTKTTCFNWLSMKTNQNEQDMKINKIIRKWPSKDQSAFRNLRIAYKSYIEAYTAGAIDLRVFEDRMTYNVTDDLDGDFFNLFMDTVNGKLPDYSDSEFAKLDQELNMIYQKILASKSNDDSSSAIPSPKSIKEVQRSWLKYREAWVDFAHLHYPAVSANSFRALLTKSKISDLKNISDQFFNTQYNDNGDDNSDGNKNTNDM